MQGQAVRKRTEPGRLDFLSTDVVMSRAVQEDVFLSFWHPLAAALAVGCGCQPSFEEPGLQWERTRQDAAESMPLQAW